MRRTQRWLKASSFGFLLLTLSNANAAVHIVATIGDAIPGKSDFLAQTSRIPNLRLADFNDRGQVLFSGIPSSLVSLGVNASSIYRGDVHGFLEIARPGDITPDGGNTYGLLHVFKLNDTGQVLFSAEFLVSGQFTGDTGFYRSDGHTIVKMVRTGDYVPDGNGRVAAWEGLETVPIVPNLFNNTGESGFYAKLTGTTGGASDQYAILKSNGNGLDQIIRSGEKLSDGNTIQVVLKPAINANGLITFLSGLSGTAGYNLYRADGNTFTQLVAYGQNSPRGDGTLSGFSDYTLNDAGQVAFYTTVATDPNDTTKWRSALFRADVSSLNEIVRTDDPAPNGNGTISLTPTSWPSFNNLGQIAFTCHMDNTSGGSADNVAIYRTGDSGLIEIARKGQLAPNGNGRFSLTSPQSSLELNDAGQVAFLASLAGTTGGTTDDAGIFLWDEIHGLTQVLRKGDPLFGSTLTSINTGLLKNRGDIAFQFSLADGRNGIAIWSVPEPVTQVLLVAGALVAGRFFARRRCT